MALTAPSRVAVVPVAASAAVRPLLTGTPATGVLLGSGERGAWARVGGETLVLAPPGGVRMPNGVELPSWAAALLEEAAGGEPCLVGGGVMVLGRRSLRVAFWWDSRPVLPRVDPPALRRRVAQARGRFTPVDDEGLGQALGAAAARAGVASARRLIGKGPGLTPLGDDVLAGALAAARLLGEAAGNRRLRRLVARVAPACCAAARERTTALAATLLRCACRGEVDDASAALLRALCGQGDLWPALDRLLAVGHSSGTGLATGILAGAAAAGGVT